MHPGAGEGVVGVRRVPALEGQQQGGGALGGPRVHRHPAQIAYPLLDALPQRGLVGPDRRVRRQQPLTTPREPIGRHGPQLRDEVHRRAGPRHQLVRERAEFEALRYGIGGRRQLVRAESAEQFRPGGEHTVVGAEELVRGADEEVRPQPVQVHRAVRREMDRVHVQQRACLVGESGDRRDVGPGADQIGRAGHRDQPGAAGELRADGLRGQFTGRRVEVGPPHHRPHPLGRLHPRADVGIVVEPADHHLVPRLPRPGQGAREVVRELGGAPAEDDPARIRAQQIRHRPPEFPDDLLRVDLAGQSGAPVGQRTAHRLADRGDDGGRGLGAAGAVEVRRAGAQGGELCAHRADVVRQGGSSVRWWAAGSRRDHRRAVSSGGRSLGPAPRKRLCGEHAERPLARGRTAPGSDARPSVRIRLPAHRNAPSPNMAMILRSNFPET
ncbi:hypothetical protein P376_1298 [Streptomyces sp. HCCB10043]|nr:hypothetical protein P376_1298 [Streptomyces sp. HCCB10043]